MQIKDLPDFVKNQQQIKLADLKFDNDGIVEHYPEELVIVVKANTNNLELKEKLKANNQGFDFYLDDNLSIGESYNIGNSKMRDSVLGVKIIDGNGDALSFGGSVMKNVAGFDVSRLLCGNGGNCIVLEISFKVLPLKNITAQNPPKQLQIDKKLEAINTKIFAIFNPNNKFI